MSDKYPRFGAIENKFAFCLNYNEKAENKIWQ